MSFFNVLAPTDANLFAQTAVKAPAIFIGKLTAVGPAPGFWSGYKRATQVLTYEVERTLKGKLAATVEVTFLLLGPGALAGQHPAIREELTKVGERYLVAVLDPKGAELPAADLAPTLATPEAVAAVERDLAH
jgi:hypothetical protein